MCLSWFCFILFLLFSFFVSYLQSPRLASFFPSFFIFYFFLFVPLFIILYAFNFLVVSFLLSLISSLLDCHLLTLLPSPLHPKCIPFFLLLFDCLYACLHFLIFFFICPYVNIKKYTPISNWILSYEFVVLHLKCKISDGCDPIFFFSGNPHLLIRFSALPVWAAYKSTAAWEALQELRRLLGWVTGGFVLLCPIR